MKCLNCLNRINYPADLVYNLTNLYSFKGKDFYYEQVLKHELEGRIKHTVEKDTIYAAKLLNLTVSDNRIKLIVKNDSQPKTKDEKVVANLKTVFKKIQEEGTELNIDDNEFLQMATKIFKGSRDIGYRQITVDESDGSLFMTKKKISKREDMKTILNSLNNAITELRIEATQVVTSAYVDLLHAECFNYANEFISLMITYAVLFSLRFNVFKYVSFFEKYTKMKAEFDSFVSFANHGYSDGFPNVGPLTSEFVTLMLEGYSEVEAITENKSIERDIRKVDDVQGIILHFEEDVFTRQDIKKAAPYLSDSTINRALLKLRDTNKIESLGTGRSAKWIKRVNTEIMSSKNTQMDIFAIIDEED